MVEEFPHKDFMKQELLIHFRKSENALEEMKTDYDLF